MTQASPSLHLGNTFYKTRVRFPLKEPIEEKNVLRWKVVQRGRFGGYEGNLGVLVSHDVIPGSVGDSKPGCSTLQGRPGICLLPVCLCGSFSPCPT